MNDRASVLLIELKNFSPTTTIYDKLDRYFPNIKVIGWLSVWSDMVLLNNFASLPKEIALSPFPFLTFSLKIAKIAI